MGGHGGGGGGGNTGVVAAAAIEPNAAANELPAATAVSGGAGTGSAGNRSSKLTKTQARRPSGLWPSATLTFIGMMMTEPLGTRASAPLCSRVTTPPGTFSPVPLVERSRSRSWGTPF